MSPPPAISQTRNSRRSRRQFVSSDEKNATAYKIADHVESIANAVGRKHLGIGSDFDGIQETPVDMRDVSAYEVLIEELVRRGWSDQDIAGILGRASASLSATALRLTYRLQRTYCASCAAWKRSQLLCAKRRNRLRSFTTSGPICRSNGLLASCRVTLAMQCGKIHNSMRFDTTGTSIAILAGSSPYA